MPNAPSVEVALLREAHNSLAAGHPGPKRTMDLMSRYFWWKGMADYVYAYVTSCQSCQQMKNSNTAPGGKLVPLAIPTSPWESVSMDFITCLPVTACGHDMLIVWVDRLTKYVILSPAKLTLNSEGFAQHTIDHVISKHGVPTELVSDRDVRFTSSFWESLTASLNTKLSMSTAFHPQTDGRTERMNRLIEETLRHYVCYAQNDWGLNI